MEREIDGLKDGRKEGWMGNKGKKDRMNNLGRKEKCIRC